MRLYKKLLAGRSLRPQPGRSQIPQTPSITSRPSPTGAWSSLVQLKNTRYYPDKASPDGASLVRHGNPVLGAPQMWVESGERGGHTRSHWLAEASVLGLYSSPPDLWATLEQDILYTEGASSASNPGLLRSPNPSFRRLDPLPPSPGALGSSYKTNARALTSLSRMARPLCGMEDQEHRALLVRVNSGKRQGYTRS